METIKVRPSKKGLVVLDSHSRQIPAQGATVKKTVHIVRSIKAGDLVVVDTKKKGKGGDQ